MATLLPLVRALGKLRQLTPADTLRLPGQLSMAGAINYAPYGTITAADNMAIEAVSANTVRVDYAGAAMNISAFGSGTSGTRRILYFNNVAPFTLLHDSSLTILPGNASIVPGRGDFAEFQCDGGVTWRCMWYQRRDGTSLVAAPDPTKLPLAGGRMTGAVEYAGYGTINAADNLAIGSVNANTVRIDNPGSPAVAINNFASGTSGTRRIILINGTNITLVHTSGFTMLPGNANILAAPGDHAEFACEGGATWRCMWYTRRDGTSLVGAPDATKLPLAGGRMTGAIDFAGYVAIAAADNVNIEAAASNTVRLDAASAVTINAFGSGTAGTRRILYFNSSLITLVHTGGLTMLPGNANILTGAGDHAEFACEGGATWRCMWYQRRNGTALVGAADATKLPLTGGRMTGAIEYAGYGTITAADNLAIEGVNANTVRVDYSGGALSVNNFASGTSGTRRILYFNNSTPFTLVHNGSFTILPGNADIIPSPGDHAEFACEGGATWRCLWYQRRSGQALVGIPDATKLPLAGGRMTGAINHAGYGTLTAADNLAIEGVNANTVRVDYSGGALSINAFGSGTSGTRRILYFNNSAPFTLIHDASFTVLPGNANIVPVAGDFAEFQCEGGATWRCMWYQRRSGQPVVPAISTLNVFAKNQSVAPSALTSGSSIAVDASLSNNFKLILATNATLANPTNLTDGMVLNFRIKQDATGSRTLAFGSKYKFPGGADKLLSTTANAVDLLSCYYDSTDDTLSCNLSKGFA